MCIKTLGIAELHESTFAIYHFPSSEENLLFAEVAQLALLVVTPTMLLHLLCTQYFSQRPK